MNQDEPPQQRRDSATPQWRDPFTEDGAARERAARRAEREARRRDSGESARQSLGERVRELSGDEPQGADGTPPEPPPLDPALPPVQPPRASARRNAAAVRRRRTGALIGVGALIAMVAGAGAIISREDDGGEMTTTPVQARKTISVTIPEGYTREDMAGVAKKAGLEGNYEKATRSTKQLDLKKLGADGAENLEGFLFPATYELYKGAKVRALVHDQLQAFEDNLAEVDPSYAKSKNLDVYDVVIIASMIEREIAVPEERKLAASVIYNRLKAGTPLGIDATIRYEDGNFDEPLLESRLNTDTPYNTRINPDLPPGPIGNPGLASLEAAANPAESNYFFYVVKPGTCNEHEFVETNAEFVAAEERYSAARDAAGGKSPTDC